MPYALKVRLRDFLRSHYRENPNGYLFANRNGNSYSIGKATEYGLWPVLEELKIKRAGLHAFRHATASELLEQGAVRFSRSFSVNYVTATPEPLFRNTGTLSAMHKDGS